MRLLKRFIGWTDLEAVRVPKDPDLPDAQRRLASVRSHMEALEVEARVRGMNR